MIYSLIGLIFFIIVLLLDIKLHFLSKVNKVICYVLCTVLLLVTGTVFYNNYNENLADKEQLYLAVQYLKEMDYDNAKLKLKSVKNDNDNDKGFVNLAANAIIGNKTNNNSLYSLNMSLAEKYYGNKKREKELIDYINSSIDDNEKYITICSNLSDILNISEKNKDKLDDYFLLESMLASGGDVDRNLYKDIEDFKTDNEDADNLYQRLVINYHLSRGDYDAALEESKLMLEQNDSKEVRYTFAEIISNMAYENYDINIFENEQDKNQAERFNKKRDELEESLKKAIEKKQLEINEDKKILLQQEVEKIQAEIEENYKKLNNSNVYKTLNFISKYEDKEANVLKAKLYYSVGEVDKAKEMLINLTETDNSLFTNNSKFDKLAEAYDISENKFNRKVAEEATKDTLIASDSIVIASNTRLINDLEKFIINDIKYNNTGISITSMDYSEYPKMKVTLDVDKLDEINVDSETFQVKDTGHEVSYTAEVDEAEGNVVFVVDKSGSMDGQPILDVKEALTSSIESMDGVRISVVEYDDMGYLSCDLTSDKDVVKDAVSGIQIGGGTNIASGLAEGIDVLLDEPGSRTIILMTDGQGSGDIQYEIDRALGNNIIIHTVGYGNQADQILKYIAEETGGEYLTTNNSSEIVYIYDLIKKYIGNNVLISYEVNESKDQLDRYVFVKLKNDDKTDKKSYMLQNEEVLVNEEGIYVNSIQPNGFNEEYMENRQYTSYIYGTNLDKISKVLLNNSEVEFTLRNNETIIIDIPENLPAGIYDLTLNDESNDEYVINYAIAVGERLNQRELTIGNVTINSNMIVLTPDGKYVCTGNNTVGSIFSTSFNLIIEADSVIKNEEDGTYDFGQSGKVYGDGQLMLDSYLYRNNINNRYNNYNSLIIRNGKFEFDCNNILSKNIGAN